MKTVLNCFAIAAVAVTAVATTVAQSGSDTIPVTVENYVRAETDKTFAGLIAMGGGKVKWVQIDVDAAAKDADHMIGADERFKLIMMRQ